MSEDLDFLYLVVNQIPPQKKQFVDKKTKIAGNSFAQAPLLWEKQMSPST